MQQTRRAVAAWSMSTVNRSPEALWEAYTRDILNPSKILRQLQGSMAGSVRLLFAMLRSTALTMQ